MANTITLSQSAYKELLQRVTKIEKMLNTLLEELGEKYSYGSKSWWGWSDKKAMEDIKKGNYRIFTSSKKLQEYLDSLK